MFKGGEKSVKAQMEKYVMTIENYLLLHISKKKSFRELLSF